MRLADTGLGPQLAPSFHLSGMPTIGPGETITADCGVVAFARIVVEARVESQHNIPVSGSHR